MSVETYKANFFTLSYYATQLLGIENERIQFFGKGLNIDLQVLSVYMDLAGRTFNDIFY